MKAIQSACCGGADLAACSGKPSLAIPSQARSREGVETRRAAPNADRYGEGIVQTTNAMLAAAKAAAGTKIRWGSRAGSSLAAATHGVKPLPN